MLARHPALRYVAESHGVLGGVWCNAEVLCTEGGPGVTGETPAHHGMPQRDGGCPSAPRETPARHERPQRDISRRKAAIHVTVGSAVLEEGFRCRIGARHVTLGSEQHIGAQGLRTGVSGITPGSSTTQESSVACWACYSVSFSHLLNTNRRSVSCFSSKPSIVDVSGKLAFSRMAERTRR